VKPFPYKRIHGLGGFRKKQFPKEGGEAGGIVLSTGGKEWKKIEGPSTPSEKSVDI